MIKCKITSQSFLTYDFIQLSAGSNNQTANNLESMTGLDFSLAFDLSFWEAFALIFRPNFIPKK